MLTMAENVIVAGADSLINEPFKYGTVTVPGTQTTAVTVRDRTYYELTNAEKIHEACDIKARNIVLQGLPQDIYNLVNHHSEAKDIWDRVKLLIESLEILLQERELKLYDKFDTFTSVPGETIHLYYLRKFIGDLEDPKEELEAEAEEDAPPAVTPPVGSLITLPPLSESSSDIEAASPVVASGALEIPSTGSTFEVGGPSSISPFPPFYLHGHEILRLNDNTEVLFSNVKYLERCEKKRRAEMDANNYEIHKVKRRMDDFDRDLGYEEKTEEMEKMKKCLETLEKNYASVLCDRDGWKKAFYNLQAWVSERFGRGAMDARPIDGVDGSAAFGEIMPPRRLKKKSVKRLVEKRVAKAIEEYEKTRANPGNVGGSGPANTGGTVNVQGCSHKTFMNGKPHPFNRTEGVVGLRRLIEKVEQVFEIYMCAEEDKVMFAASTFEGRASMMTTEYCPTTKIQRMEEELWTLTLKGDDIEAYNNRFHKLALMCPDLVQNEKKKIERYIRGFPERIKGNITSSRPTTLHDAINMAHELVEQAILGKAARVSEINKRKWEDHQKNNPNNNNPNNRNRNRNNNHHQQPNRRQETAKAYAAAPAGGRGYNGNLPWCHRCKAHHHQGLCPPKCGRCNKLGHQEKDCRVRIPATGGNALQDVTCFGCGEKGHYMHKCPKGRNQQNKGAVLSCRAYMVIGL
ncbi:putative reverse transcriptase domain-containing protein [Tanacetum coccineum]